MDLWTSMVVSTGVGVMAVWLGVGGFKERRISGERAVALLFNFFSKKLSKNLVFSEYIYRTL